MDRGSVQTVSVATSRRPKLQGPDEQGTGFSSFFQREKRALPPPGKNEQKPVPCSSAGPPKSAKAHPADAEAPPFAQAHFGARRGENKGLMRRPMRLQRRACRGSSEPRNHQSQRGPPRCPRFARLSAKRTSVRAVRKTRAKMGCLGGLQRRAVPAFVERRNYKAKSGSKRAETEPLVKTL